MSRDQVHARRWGILGVLVLALFGVSLDNTILTIALPTLSADLDASASQLQWMVDAYVLVFAGLLLVAGAMSDRYGRKRALVSGLVLFGLGSAIAPLVTDAQQLIALRAFMGLGAALTMPATLSIIADVFEADERPKAIAAWSAVSGLGIVVGPILGGWLLEHYAWASVFLINVPFVVVGILATLAIVPESRSPERAPLDPVGAVLSVAGLVALVYGIIEVPSKGWSDPTIVASLAAAAVLLDRLRHLGAAHRPPHARRQPVPRSPVLRREPVRDADVLQPDGRAVPADAIPPGRPRPVGARDRPPVHPDRGRRDPRLARRGRAHRPHRHPARHEPRAGRRRGRARPARDARRRELGPARERRAVRHRRGHGPRDDARRPTRSCRRCRKAQFGVGSAVNDATREIGGALGVAVLGSLFAGTYATHVADGLAGLPPVAAQAAGQSLAGAAAVAQAVGGEAGAAILAVARQSFVDGMTVTAIVGVGFAVAGAIIAFAFLPDRVTAADEGEAAATTTVAWLPRGDTTRLTPAES